MVLPCIRVPFAVLHVCTIDGSPSVYLSIHMFVARVSPLTMLYEASSSSLSHYSELHDFTTVILSEVCTNVCIKSALHPLYKETFDYATSDAEDST